MPTRLLAAAPPAPPPRRRRRHLLRLRRSLLLAAISTPLLLLLLLLLLFRLPSKPSSSAGDGGGGDLTGDRVAALVQAPQPPPHEGADEVEVESSGGGGGHGGATCATVERMGEEMAAGASPEMESLRVREVIRRHFHLHGAARVRELPSHEFCRQGFVLGKASQAGFGNEMYKILTAAALGVMLNRSLIIGQTRGLYPFGEYISYTNNSFTLGEIKHLWRKNGCAKIYGRNLKMRVDNFENPAETNVLCSDWNKWKDPIIWFQGTTDAVGIQFFLKSIHPGMRHAASVLFGWPDYLQGRPNVFGELMHAIISPSQAVQEAVDWVLKGADPDITLHMRMLTNRSLRATKAAAQCIKRVLASYHLKSTPRVALVSDTPSFVKEIAPYITDFAEVIQFDYKLFEKRLDRKIISEDKSLDFRTKDWGPAPRWVAFVDFFLASRAKHAIVTGAHHRVGTTYAQLIAALAAAHRHGDDSGGSNFSFFSSIQCNLLVDGLSSQVGWGHIWNRFAGPLSCRRQRHQCAFTPLLALAWWDGHRQSPIPRDIRRLVAYGVRLSNTGEVDERRLKAFCRSRKDRVKTYQILRQCKNSTCS